MAVEETPLGFKKPNGQELVRNGDNVISDNAQKAEDLLAAVRARLAMLEGAAGFPGPGLDLADAVVNALLDTATITRNKLDARYSTTINVKNYGAKGDGSTNDTAAIQAAIAAAPNGSVIWFEPGKVYPIHAALTNGGKSLHLRSNGATLLSKTHASQIEFSGSWGTVYPVSAVTAGTVTHNSETRAVLNLTVTGTVPYQRGQVVKVYADDVLPGARPGSGGLESRSGQFGVVYASTAGNLSILVRELIDPLTTNIRVSSMNDITASVEGFIFDTDESLMVDGGRSNCVVLTDLVRPSVQSCEVRNSTAQAVQVNSCYGYRVKDVEIDESNDSTVNAQFGYGVLDNSSSYGVVDGLLVNFVRHAFSDDTPRIATNSGPSLYGRTYTIDVINGMGYGTSNTTWDTHAASQNVRFINCVALGSGGPGFGLRGRKHTVRGGMVGSGRDYGVYAFSESGLDTDSWGHTVENVDIEAPQYPVLFAVQKGTNTREARKSYISNIRIKKPNDLSLWFVNTTAQIGNITIDDIQMSTASTANIKLDNAKVMTGASGGITQSYKTGLANNGPMGVQLVNGSDFQAAGIYADINGTTNGTRFAAYVTAGAPFDGSGFSTSVYRIGGAGGGGITFTSNPAGVANFATDHTDSYVGYMTPAGNALGISSSYVPFTQANVTASRHQVSRLTAPHITWAGAVTAATAITTLRGGRSNGQQLTIVNTGTANITISHDPAEKITTTAGTTITLIPGQRALFFWDGANGLTWRQLA